MALLPDCRLSRHDAFLVQDGVEQEGHLVSVPSPVVGFAIHTEGFDGTRCCCTGRGSFLGEVGIDIVVLTADSWDAYRVALEITRHGGRVSILGFPGRGQSAPDFNPLDPRWIYEKQLALLGVGPVRQLEYSPEDCRFNTRRNLNCILSLMVTQRPGLESIITHRFPASRMKEVYELARNHDKTLAAAVFDWRLPHEL